MEQMYLIEVFIEKVTVFAKDDESIVTDKNFMLRVKFGPSVEFNIRENLMSNNVRLQSDVLSSRDGKKKLTRTLKVGKSYLFPSYPDTVHGILLKYPLEVELWNDDLNEDKLNKIYVGHGHMEWDKEFLIYLKENADTCAPHKALSSKEKVVLYDECCCKQVGNVSLIVRIHALGDSIITDFQQPHIDPHVFCFRTDKAPSMFRCRRIERDDVQFTPKHHIYDTTVLQDPCFTVNEEKKIEVCTELQSCAIGNRPLDEFTCQVPPSAKDDQKKYPIDKIRIGDISGPCGNPNCPLAHKVKTYMRNLDAYKKEVGILGSLAIKDPLGLSTKKVCGSCDCKDDRFHRYTCKVFEKEIKDAPNIVCKQCGGLPRDGETCETKENKLYGTGVTPKTSNTTNYLIAIKRDPVMAKAVFGDDYVVNTLTVDTNRNVPSYSQGAPTYYCTCQTTNLKLTASISAPNTCFNIDTLYYKQSNFNIGFNNPLIYNVEVTKEGKGKTATTVVDEDKECKCGPPKPAPPCRTLNCECLDNVKNVTSRKRHKSYCPLYKHKNTCPVTMQDVEENNDNEEPEEAEVLPYGLPPIKLGPCPVLGRPCTVPDGFARMYKPTALPPLPPSYSEAGKVCCSKEYERIKKAVKEYLINTKEKDMRCVNKYNVDTETRCCDQEQVLLSMMGKSCCGTHKRSLLEKITNPTEKK